MDLSQHGSDDSPKADDGGQKPKNDKLDRWIEQNVHIDSGGHQPAQKPHPQTYLENKSSLPQPAKPPAGRSAAEALAIKCPEGYPLPGSRHQAHQGHQPRPQAPLAHSSRQAPAPVSHTHKHQTPQTHPPQKLQQQAQQPHRTPGKFMRFFGGPKMAKQSSAAPADFHGKLRIIPLGGLDEVGKNCMVLEYMHDIIIIDAGFQFPKEDMLGIDYVIPDITYLEDKLDRIKGIVITHGHLDHIGALPYLLPKLQFPPIYATKLTMGLINKRLEEFGQEKQTKMHVVTADDVLQLGPFNTSFFRVNHSIPDSVGIVVKTPAGNIVHTGDFKFDFTPSGDQKPPDFAKIASLASQNIAALFIDSTNALKHGYTISEKKLASPWKRLLRTMKDAL